MFKLITTWLTEHKRKKREKWELENLSDEMKEKYNLTNVKLKGKDKQIRDLTDRVYNLEIKFDLLKQLVADRKPTKKTWRVLQDELGETEWFRTETPVYVSKVYRNSADFMFDVIIDGQKISYSYPSYEEASSYKLKIIDVERVEEFDEETQREIVGTKDSPARDNISNTIINDVLDQK